MCLDLSKTIGALFLATIWSAGTARAQAVPQGQDAQLVSILPAANGPPTLVGTSGELYEPSGVLQWRRKHAGGVSVTVEKVYRSLQGALYAVGQSAPLFELEDGTWSMSSLVRRGVATTSPGTLPIFAVQRSIFELGKTGFRKIASAKGSVEAIWASSASRLYVLTSDQKLWAGRGGSWRPISIQLADKDRITRLTGVEGREAVALTSAQRLFLLGQKSASEIFLAKDLEGLKIHALAQVKGQLLLAGVIGVGPQRVSILAQIEKDEVHKLRDLWQLAPDDQFAILAADQKNRLLVATMRGSVAVLDAEGNWTTGSVFTETPAGPPRRADQAPALAR